MPASLYKVVINHEEQYRLLPADARLPLGWRPTGLPIGTLGECRAQLVKFWKNPRPGQVERVVKEAQAASQ